MMRCSRRRPRPLPRRKASPKGATRGARRSRRRTRRPAAVASECRRRSSERLTTQRAAAGLSLWRCREGAVTGLGWPDQCQAGLGAAGGRRRCAPAAAPRRPAELRRVRRRLAGVRWQVRCLCECGRRPAGSWQPCSDPSPWQGRSMRHGLVALACIAAIARSTTSRSFHLRHGLAGLWHDDGVACSSRPHAIARRPRRSDPSELHA